jgi:hypothetical protein
MACTPPATKTHPTAAAAAPRRAAPPRAGRPAVPVTLWPVAQTSAQYQRAGRYLPQVAAHPGKMLPALAAAIIDTFSRPGDLVCDPMCGIGTTLVEAAARHRHAVGIEREDRWARLAVANAEHVLDPPDQARVEVITGDARRLPALLGALAERVDLIVVSPPYGCDAGTIDKPAWRAGRRLCDTATLNYGDKANLGHARGATYATAMTEIYTGCAAVLKPGGLLVTVTKNTRRNGRLFDLAGLTVQLARTAGFRYLQHIVALHTAVRNGDLAGRPSFWQLTQTRAARRRDEPAHLVVHEDVLVFRAIRGRRPDNAG